MHTVTQDTGRGHRKPLGSQPFLDPALDVGLPTSVGAAWIASFAASALS